MKEAWLVIHYNDDNTKTYSIYFEQPWDTWNSEIKHIVYAEIE